MGRLEIEKVLIDDTKSETFNGGKIWKDVSPCLRSSRYGHKICEIKQVAQMYGTEREPNPQAGRIYDADGISPTMDSCSGGNRMPKILDVEKVGWRLMGFTDECFRMAEEVNSNSQLYKQAGNSIVVNVLEKIIKNIGLGGTSNEETI